MSIIQPEENRTLNTTPMSNPTLIAEGKTKRILAVDDETVLIVSKDDITAGDGAKHDVMKGKAQYSTTTTCNVFRLLRRFVSTAFIEQIDEVTFKAVRCKMLPYEVVVRREAHGSYLKRMPTLEKGFVFNEPIKELFLKTNNRKWRNYNLICDDPLMIHNNAPATISLYDPAIPLESQEPFLVLDEEEVFTNRHEEVLLDLMLKNAEQVFLILEDACKRLGKKLLDFKVEYGINARDGLLLADVIDGDSWRLVDEEGVHLDKQPYRENAAVADVAEKYRILAELTKQF